MTSYYFPGLETKPPDEVQENLAIVNDPPRRDKPSKDTQKNALTVMMELVAFLASCPDVAFTCSVIPGENATIILAITGILILDGNPYKFAIRAFRYGPPTDNTRIFFDITCVKTYSENSLVAFIYDVFVNVVMSDIRNHLFTCPLVRFNATIETMHQTADEIVSATRSTLMTGLLKLTTENPEYFWLLDDNGLRVLALAIHSVFLSESNILRYLALRFIEECVCAVPANAKRQDTQRRILCLLFVDDEQGRPLITCILDWCQETLEVFEEEQPNEDVNKKLFTRLILKSIARLFSRRVGLQDTQDLQGQVLRIFCGLLWISEKVHNLLEHGHNVPAEEEKQ